MPVAMGMLGSMKLTWRKAAIGLAAVVGVFGLMQLVPYRISNPPVTQEPKWDSPQTRALVVAACYDCHSNETKKPWYGQVAPVSWWLKNHVDVGRASVNYSEWDKPQGEGKANSTEAVQNGSMPPAYYTWFGLHSGAKLSSAQRAALIAGLIKTFGR
jgi:hypothetical protein